MYEGDCCRQNKSDVKCLQPESLMKVQLKCLSNCIIASIPFSSTAFFGDILVSLTSCLFLIILPCHIKYMRSPRHGPEVPPALLFPCPHPNPPPTLATTLHPISAPWGGTSCHRNIPAGLVSSSPQSCPAWPWAHPHTCLPAWPQPIPAPREVPGAWCRVCPWCPLLPDPGWHCGTGPGCQTLMESWGAHAATGALAPREPPAPAAA